MLDEAGLLECRSDESGEQGVGIERLRLEFRVELHANKPWMIGSFDNLGK